MCRIREIPFSEIHIIKPLWEGLNRMHLADSPYFKDQYAAFTFEQRVADLAAKAAGGLRATVLEDGVGDAVGYCVSTVDGNSGEIDSLYLDERMRGRGWGKALVEDHLAWLRGKGAKKIKLAVSYGHDEVLEFYHKLGFYERLTYMELKER